MDTIHSNLDNFNENQSLKVIREMIKVSQKKMRNDGILLVLWGWINLCTNLSEYLLSVFTHTYQIRQLVNYEWIVLTLFGIGFTIIYIYRQRKKVTTYIGISLRYIWIALFFSMVIINLIQFNILHKIIFELQHPIFMVLISFAIVATGGILRYRLLIIGGVIFGSLAYLSSLFPIQAQMLIEAIAWFFAFVIPGHILYSKRKINV